MAGRGRGRGGREGRGSGDSAGGRGDRGGRSTTFRTRSIKTGLTKELEGHIFDLGERSSADLMRTTQVKIAQYMGSLYGGDIMGELETKKEFVPPTAEYPPETEKRRLIYQSMMRKQYNNEHDKLLRKRQRAATKLAERRNEGADDSEIEQLEDELTELDNNILKVDYDRTADINLPMTDEEKAEWRMSQKLAEERASKHLVNQQKAFALIVGQCTQRLQDKLHEDSQWEAISMAKKPLELYTLIERVVLNQTGDEYPPNNLVDNLLAVLQLKQQNNQSNAQWYEMWM